MTTADPIAAAGLTGVVAHARAVPGDARDAFATAALARANDPRVIVLRTCHRVEVYAVDRDCDGPPVDAPAPPPGGVRLEGVDAARHLFRVAAGLDSVVVGEDQVLHQLRECLADRRRPADGRAAEATADAAGPLHPLLVRAFEIALRVGRRTRSWREGPPRSLADVALDAVAARTGPLDGRRVLVVGAGRMGRLAAQTARSRGAHVLVANRSGDRANALAAEVHGETARFGGDGPLPEVDAVILALSGPWPIGPAARERLVGGALPVIDLSSPPALDEGTRSALGSRFTSVDDLAAGPGELLGQRLRRRVDAAVEDAITELERWTRARSTVGAIQALTDRAEARRSQELDRLFRRADLTTAERELVEQMSQRLVAALLHAPIVTLRDDESGHLEAAARTLFEL